MFACRLYLPKTENTDSELVVCEPLRRDAVLRSRKWGVAGDSYLWRNAVGGKDERRRSCRGTSWATTRTRSSIGPTVGLIAAHSLSLVGGRPKLFLKQTQMNVCSGSFGFQMPSNRDSKSTIVGQYGL